MCIPTRLFVLAILCLPGLAAARPACTDPVHRQFDFWLGSWEVTTPDGALAGNSRIEASQDGCVLHERYATPKGFDGQSLNIHDRTRGVWHQTWVDNTGTLLELEGGLVDGRMVLEGNGRRPDGTPVRHRITWTPNGDGTVRQLWESMAAGGTWQVVFDGLYRKDPG